MLDATSDAAVTIRARGLHRWFDKRGRERLHAVQGVDLTAHAGRVIGFLGPNGAGKTTTIRMCATLLAPSAGTVEVAGFDVVRQTRDVRRNIGLVVGGDRGFYLRATARENLRYFADLAGVGRRVQKQRNDSLLESVGLAARADDRVEDYSRGMRQRLHIARALLADPPVLLLDEPTIGLDPEAAVDLRKLIADLAGVGRTVLLTTHYLHEAEALSHTVNVIVSGKVVVEGSVQDVARAAGVGEVTTVAADAIPKSAIEELFRLEGVAGVELTEVRGTTMGAVAWRHGFCEPDRVAAILTPWNPRVLTTRPATLEEAYLALVSTRRRQPTEAPVPAANAEAVP